MIEALLEHLRAAEGWRSCVYRDHLGYWTIGYGFMVDERRGGGMPRAIGDYWLRHAIDGVLRELAERWPKFAEQPEHVRIAVAAMAYQLGVGGVLGFRAMLGALEHGRIDAACTHALDSLWARQTPARARRVVAMMRGSRDENVGSTDSVGDFATRNDCDAVRRMGE